MGNEAIKYWRLIAERQCAMPDIFDLRVKKSIYVGDDSRNDICIETVAVPFQFKVVRLKRSGPILTLTSETIPSLLGEYHAAKEWKNRLYQGREFAIDGPCEFKIGDTHFKLLQIESMPISSLQEAMPPEEKKHWRQSIQYTAALYAVLALISITVSALVSIFSTPNEATQVQKITVADVQKIIKKPVPRPVDTPISPKIDEINSSAPQKQNAVSKATRNITSASGKTGGAKVRDIQSMGLLAIQTAPSGISRVSMAVSAPKYVNSKSKLLDEPQLGLGNATSGVGLGDGNATQVAQLGSLSGTSYEGGLGAQLQTGKIASIALLRKEVEVRGALDPGVIRQIIEERLSEIRYCYENALLKQKELAGKVAASWTIRSDGSVDNIQSASEEIRPEILQPCIRLQIKNWRFPNPKGGGSVHVKYPFVFSPVGGQ